MADLRTPLTRPWMDDREADAARRVIRSGWVTQGPEVATFEREFASVVGAAHACAVSSCTAALHLALRAVGVGPGHEVVTPSYSYVATANAIRYCGAVPVFADIEAGSPNLDLGEVEACVGERTRAILCVHQMGMPCDVRGLAEIALGHGIPLIEDAACAIGSEVIGKHGFPEAIGRPHGHIACFSFHPRKLLTTGDGGMLTTRDPEIDARFRRERQHGVDVPAWARHAASPVAVERHVSLGFNYRMTDIQAAVGRVQLSRLHEMLVRRRFLAERYGRLLQPLPVAVPRAPDWARTNWQTFWIEVADRMDRDLVMQRMRDAGVATRRGISCAHREPVYTSEPWRAGPRGLPNSERAQDRGLMLPLYHEMTEADQDFVVEVLAAALSAGAVRTDR